MTATYLKFGGRLRFLDADMCASVSAQLTEENCRHAELQLQAAAAPFFLLPLGLRTRLKATVRFQLFLPLNHALNLNISITFNIKQFVLNSCYLSISSLGFFFVFFLMSRLEELYSVKEKNASPPLRTPSFVSNNLHFELILRH